MEHPVRSSESLYRAFQATRDRRLLEELVKRVHRDAFAVAMGVCRNPELAEEAVQEALLGLLRKPDSFQPKGEGSFQFWFQRVVVNAAKMALRTELREKRKKPSKGSHQQGHRRRPDAANENASVLWSELAALLKSLEEGLAEPLTLYYLRGLRQKEVAHLLGVSQQAVGKRIQKALNALRSRSEPLERSYEPGGSIAKDQRSSGGRPWFGGHVQECIA